MKNKIPVLISLMLGTAMAALDNSIVNVSLPIMKKQFGAGISDIEWVITGYMVSFCLFIPLVSWLKNRVGYYNLFLASIIIFTIGSLVCSLSPSLSLLVAARVFQAIGGGAIAPVSLGIIGESFPREERGSAISWWGIGNVMGPAVGPTLGGLLTHYFGWPSIFYVNVPIGIIAVFMTIKYLGFLKNEPTSKPRFDIAGYICFVSFILLLQFALSFVAHTKTNLWKSLLIFISSAIFLILFIRSSKKPEPLLQLSVFKSQIFICSAVIVFIRSLALFGGLFFLPFLLQGLMGYSAMSTGLLLLPNAIMMLIFRPYAGRLADKGIIRRPSVTGIICIAVSMIQFSTLVAGSSVWLIVAGMVVRGFGMSLLVSPVSTALLNSVTETQTPTATSINSLLQQVGGSVGIAISGILHVHVSKYFIDAGRVVTVAEHLALQMGFITSGVVVALALIPALKLPDINKKQIDVREVGMHVEAR